MELLALSKLTDEQKDRLILSQSKLIEKLEAKIKALEDRLSKNSSNSSKPPSSDGFNKPNPKSRRGKNKKKKVGGQKGHVGKTLEQVSDPNYIEHHDPVNCWACQHTLSTAGRLHHESRQVFDLPPLDLEVTEHRAHKKCCENCGAITKGIFPAGVTQATQYGSKIRSLMVYMNQYQLLLYDHEREFIFDIFNQAFN